MTSKKFSIELDFIAINSISDAYDFYEKRSIGLGDRFIDVIENQFQILIKNPFLYPVKKFNNREAYISNFPFVVIYAVNEQRSQIVILNVFHTSQNPEKKQQ